MAIGLPRSWLLSSASMSCLFVAVCICILGNFLFLVQARPMSSDGSPQLLADEFESEAEWLGPGKEEAVGWRAFEPSKTKSNFPWWEREMNDNLWDPNSVFEYPEEDYYYGDYDSPSEKSDSSTEVEGNKPAPEQKSTEETISPSSDSQVQESPHEEADTKQVSDNIEGEETVSQENVDDEKSDVKSLTDNSGLDPSFIKRGGIDTFVNDNPEGFYSSSLGERTWKSSDSMKPYLNKVQTQPDEPAEAEQDVDTTLEEKADEPPQPVPDVKEGGGEESPEDKAETTEEKTPAGKDSNSVALESGKVSLESLVAAQLMHGSPITGDEVKTSDSDEKPEPDDIEVKEEDNEKKSEDVEQAQTSFREENDVYGKGESISPMMDGTPDKAEEAVNEKSEVEESKSPLKEDEKFEDWEDWDDSAFDEYYDSEDDEEEEEDDDDDDEDLDSDDEDDDDSEDEDTDVGKGTADEYEYDDESYEDEEDEDDDASDDYYDEEDEDENNEDVENDDDENDDEENDDQSEEVNEGNKKGIQSEEDITATNYKNNVKLVDEKQSKLSDSSTKAELKSQTPSSYLKNNIDFDAATLQKDKSHYSKGTIYDYSSSFHSSKKSVKKDLTNPANHRQVPSNLLPKSNTIGQQDVPEKTSESKTVSKKDSVVTHVQPDRLSTGLESLTSPNPRPTVHTWSDTSQSSTNPSPSTIGWPSTEDVMMGDQPRDDDPYVNSHPLEYCKLDYECKAGRTCVQGMCKCVKADFCAGHYKPVCGSDGVQYPSHCELHRTACLNRLHIRVDRRGRCFKEAIMKKEKSWLLQQEKLLIEGDKKTEGNNNAIQIKSEEIYEYPGSTKNDEKAKEVKKALLTTTTPKPKVSENCSLQEMSKFKNDLLMYYCVKFVEPNCKLEVRTDRQYLSMLMFSYYDINFDFFLSPDELDDKERDEHFDKNLIKNCHLKNFVKVADTDKVDGLLTVSEFTNSFGMMPTAPTKNDLEVISTLASAGDGLDLKCGIQADNIIWKRYGMQLKDDQKNHKLMIFDDGALFLSELGVHHIGNFTCMNAEDETEAQIHRLSVQTVPVVVLTPIKQTIVSGSDIVLRCHAEGVPEPKVSWKFQGKEIHNTDRVVIYHGQDHILIHNTEFGQDNGTYTCSAHNQAGTTEKSVTVDILPQTASYDREIQETEGSFIVFHDRGIKIYDPTTCLARRVVPNDFGNFKFIPDAMDSPLTLCRDEQKCQWADAVKVGTELIYISQPDQNRLVVMEAGHYWNPLQVIDTDPNPEKLLYVPHLDQVWVLCKRENTADSDKTIIVIRDASQYIQHRSVHTRPVGNHFDTVKDLFISPPNDLHHEFDHGYVTHTGQYSLTKISLEDMSYSKTIDLSNYGCVPQNLAFLPLAGHIIIECVSEADQHTLQLVMDYLTDAIISTTSLSGQPNVSPDARHLVTVDKFTGKVVVVSVSEEGEMETTYEVTVSASISDLSFMPSVYHHGYDLILTSADDDDVIIMNLVTGRVEKMQGSKLSDPSQPWHPSPVFRHIVSGDPTSNLLMTPAKSSLSILDFRFKQVECEFIDITGNQVMVHVPTPHVK